MTNGSAGQSSSVAYMFVYWDRNTDITNCFGNAEIYITNYAQSGTKNVSITGATQNAGTNYQSLNAGSYFGSAISSIVLEPQSSSTFIQYTTASLYAITKGEGGATIPVAKATGGTIAYSGGYFYHTFTSSGTFTPTQTLTADILTIAGGGGGGNYYYSGGGGAGGVVYNASEGLNSGVGYTVTVGAGGVTGKYSDSTYSTNGNDSSFFGRSSASGGGRAGGYNGSSWVGGNSGGSGGGGSAAGGGTTTTAGSGTAGQGYAGGNGKTGSPATGGGGGGAGAAGQIGQSNRGGQGGVGTSTYSTWASATGTGHGGYYAGGGGGGEEYGSNYPSGGGGQGGGGGGTTNNGQPAFSGTANTGGGSGGNGNNMYTAATGGSGIVIVRYAA